MQKPFDRIITVMFENQYRNYVIQNPFLKKLAAAGADMTNYFGAFHPSQTNYLASLAGEVCGVTNDTPPSSPLMQKTLADLLEEKNVSWKAYMEAYPGDPWNKAWEKPNYPLADQPINQYPPANAKELSRYYRKHNAFASFHSIQKDETKWNKIQSDVEFWKDVNGKTLPEYSWFTPDIWNDGHYLYNTHIDTNPRTQLVPQLSAWLEHVFFGEIDTVNIQGGSETGLDKLGLNLDLDLLLTNPQKAWAQSHVPKGTLIVVTFDEADFDAEGYDTNYDGPNQIYTVLLGDMITPGTVISTPYNHYNLIKTVEENFQLGSLNKNDFGANWFRFLWGESFSWDDVTQTDIKSDDQLAICSGNETEHLVFSNAKGELEECFLKDSRFTQPKKIGFTSSGQIAITTIDQVNILVFVQHDGLLMMSTFIDKNSDWSTPVSLGQITKGSIALTTYYDSSTTTYKMMLCWVSDHGFIDSMTGDVNGFSGDVVPVNQLTDGEMTLGQVGASLYLVYKERNSRKMRITSFNVGAFNAFEGVDFQDKPAPENNTTLNQWSVCDFTVGHFAKKMAALKNEYQCMGSMAMTTISGEMHLVHRGGYADLSNAYTEVFGLTGVYSAANQFTNGFGTLVQAGWTLEDEMPDVMIGQTDPIAICANEQRITLVWRDVKSGFICFRQGGYVKTKAE